MVKKKFNENSTLMGRMGFKDPDLKSPTHDDVIMWLYQEGTIKELCKNHILPIYIERSFNDHYGSYEEITEQEMQNYEENC